MKGIGEGMGPTEPRNPLPGSKLRAPGAAYPLLPSALRLFPPPASPFPPLPARPPRRPSPVVRAETLRFKEEGVFGVVKDVFLPWYNAYRWGPRVKGDQWFRRSGRGVWFMKDVLLPWYNAYRWVGT